MITFFPSLNWLDWLSLTFFVGVWVGYTIISTKLSQRRNSLTSMLSLYRRDWMYQLLSRDVRIHDITLVAVFERNCAFFASSSLLIIAGLLSLMGYATNVTRVFSQINQPITVDKFVAITLLLAMVFVYTFFVFTWSMRQFGFVGIMIVSAPTKNTRHYTKKEREEFSVHCAKIADLASLHLNYGLRAYYFSLAVLGWYIDPLVFMLATSLVVAVLYQREFASRAVGALALAHKDIDASVNQLDDDN